MTRAQHSARVTRLATIQTVAIVIQTVAVVFGLVFAGFQLRELAEQNKQTKMIASAQLVIDIDKIFENKPYSDIATFLDDKSDVKVRAKFGDTKLSDYLSWYETIGDLFSNENILLCSMVYNEFADGLVKAYKNHDIQRMIQEDQKDEPDTWKEFQRLGKRFSERNPCKISP